MLSSKFAPTAPASSAAITVSARLPSSGPYPLSKSAVTGRETFAEMRATTLSISSRLIHSPSEYPRDHAMPPLDVAITGNSAFSTIFALPESHTLGKTRIGGSSM